MPEDSAVVERLVRLETKLDIVIGQHDSRLSDLEKKVGTLNNLRWFAVGACMVALGSGGISLMSILGG